MGSVNSFERWNSKSAVVYTAGREVRYGLFGPKALTRLAGLPRLRWIRLEDIASPWASYRSIMAQEERAIVVMSDLLDLHGRRVFDHEIILSPKCCDLLILISRAPTSFITDVKATTTCG
jgi:hypothetical protein